MNYKKYIIIALVVIAVLGAGLLIAIKIKVPKVVPNVAEQAQQAEILKIEKEKKYQEQMQILSEVVDKTRLTDNDLDGLTNDEEKNLGTDPDNSDTDSDGLTDSTEVNIYKTNPLKADTDGDGYPDGEEVRRGYNPSGSGKLKK
ncbi:MAG: hypothetical protein ACD_72C00398G0002 [uncultured bacterium]|nr:MAG: hypothetical protein ACD_72C00398G0002 [uncultured bacterium]